MLYYKKIDISDYDKIVIECLSYIKSKDFIYNRRYPASYYPLDFEEFSKNCPLVIKSFDKLGLICNYGAAYVSYNNLQNIVHKDNYTQDARINIPLLNCENTKTNFYKGGDFSEKKNLSTMTRPWVMSSISDLILVDSVVIDKPTIIRVNEPHQVLMNSKFFPRITLTLGFTVDPIFMLAE